MTRLPGAAMIITLTVLHLGCAISPAAPVGGTFVNVGDDTVPRFFHNASLLQDGRVMVSGGMTLQLFPPSLISLDRLSFFDPAADTFSNSFTPTGGGPPVSPRLAIARSSHTQTTLADGRVLLTGGNIGASGTNPGVPTASVEWFDPATGAVSAGPPMSEPRSDHTANLLADGRVLVAGGSAAQAFNPAGDTWSPPITLARSRIGHAAVRLAGFRGPGQDSVLLVAGAFAGQNTLEIIDPDAGSSQLMASTLAVPVDDLAAEALPDGTVLIVGGQSLATGNTIDHTYRYDPVADTLVAVDPPPNRPLGIADHAIVSLGRYVAIFGGEQEQAGTDTELDYCAIYDSQGNTWPFVAAMNRVHDDFPAVRLLDGRILLIGGGAPFFGNAAPTVYAEVFVPILPLPGDMNDDGAVNELDIPLFLSVLLDPVAAPPEQLCAADLNADDAVDGLDAGPFVEALLGD